MITSIIIVISYLFLMVGLYVLLKVMGRKEPKNKHKQP